MRYWITRTCLNNQISILIRGSTCLTKVIQYTDLTTLSSLFNTQIWQVCQIKLRQAVNSADVVRWEIVKNYVILVCSEFVFESSVNYQSLRFIHLSMAAELEAETETVSWRERERECVWEREREREREMAQIRRKSINSWVMSYCLWTISIIIIILIRNFACTKQCEQATVVSFLICSVLLVESQFIYLFISLTSKIL